jgi:hypothetical protein
MRQQSALRFVFTFLVALSILFSGIARAQADAPGKICTSAHLTGKAEVRGYVFKSYRDPSDDTPPCVRVYLRGKLVYTLTSDDALTYTLGQPAEPTYRIPFVANGTDLTGNGHPDMIVTSWSGGAHCCFAHYIFELEPEFQLITKIEDGNGYPAHFEDLDHNGRYFYVTNDIWPYWPDSFAGSVSHKVILRWDKNKVRLDLERMKFRAPSPKQWRAALKDVDAAANDRSSLGVTLWDTVLDLIYTGHSELAWKFVKEANPKALTGNNASLEDFCVMLKSSQFWPGLEPTLKDVPDECAKAKEKSQK